MRKHILFLGLACLAAGPSQAQNLLTNGDFESDTSGWSLNRADTSTRGTLSFTSGSAHTGTRGIAASITTVVSSKNWGIRILTPAFTATKGNKYTISFWGKSDSIRPVTIAFQSSGGSFLSSHWPVDTVKAGWQQFNYTVLDTFSGGGGNLVFALYLGVQAGTYSFDDFSVTEENLSSIVLNDAISFPDSGVWFSGRYRNLLAERGYNPDSVTAKLNSDFNQLFFGDSGTQAIYRTVGTDEAFIDGIDTTTNGQGQPNGKDIRTEGMSYGMMIALQLNRQDIFNKLWKFAKTRMQQASGDGAGYFAWRLSNTSPYAPIDVNPAPDGEEYFVSALFLADKRWHSATDPADMFNYKQQADSILYYMVKARSGSIGPLVDPAHKMIVFSPAQASPYTDPSYHIPAFYRMWSAFSSHDTALWRQMADSSLAFWKRNMNSATGLNSDKAQFDGTPYSTVYYSYDAHRTPMYVGMDWAWFKADPWEVSQTKRNLAFFRSQGAYVDNYNLDGTAPSGKTTYGAGGSQIGSNAAAVLASDTSADWKFVDNLWNSDCPTGNYRYYAGLVRMLGLLHVSGNFKAWGSPGMLAMAGVQPRAAVASALRTSLRGRDLSLFGLEGATVRLLDLRGHVAASAAVVGQRATLTAPGSGLWIVEAGKARVSIVVP